MDRLTQIFEKQASYLATLAPIYLNNGAHIHASVPPWPLNERMVQEEFRLLAWRITEEVYEAIVENTIKEGDDTTPKAVSLRADAYKEEVSDVLHFLIELAIVSGVTANVLVFGSSAFALNPAIDYLSFVFDAEQHRGSEFDPDEWQSFLARLANQMMLLRQRPWRTDNRLTSTAIWERGFFWLFRSYISCCVQTGLTADDLYEAYFAKNKINDQRTAEQKL